MHTHTHTHVHAHTHTHTRTHTHTHTGSSGGICIVLSQACGENDADWSQERSQKCGGNSSDVLTLEQGLIKPAILASFLRNRAREKCCVDKFNLNVLFYPNLCFDVHCSDLIRVATCIDMVKSSLIPAIR